MVPAPGVVAGRAELWARRGYVGRRLHHGRDVDKGSNTTGKFYALLTLFQDCAGVLRPKLFLTYEPLRLSDVAACPSDYAVSMFSWLFVSSLTMILSQDSCF